MAPKYTKWSGGDLGAPRTPPDPIFAKKKRKRAPKSGIRYRKNVEKKGRGAKGGKAKGGSGGR